LLTALCFAAEFAGAEKCLLEAAAMGERTGKARIVNILSFFGSCESLPQDLTTVDGASIWAGDGVHLTSNAIRVAARKLMTDLVNGGEDGEPENKRARLESVVPVPAPAPAKKKERGKEPAADIAAETGPASDTTMALRPTPAISERTRFWTRIRTRARFRTPPRSRTPRRTATRRRERRQPRRQRRKPRRQQRTMEAPKGRPVRPLGPLVNGTEEKIPRPRLDRG
jgi:hypothetical protein